jgi:hypothetical protein
MGPLHAGTGTFQLPRAAQIDSAAESRLARLADATTFFEIKSS